MASSLDPGEPGGGPLGFSVTHKGKEGRHEDRREEKAGRAPRASKARMESEVSPEG